MSGTRDVMARNVLDRIEDGPLMGDVCVPEDLEPLMGEVEFDRAR